MLLDKCESDETLIETFSVYLDEEFNTSDTDIFNSDTFKSFLLEQISQFSPPETQPLPKRPEPPKRRMSFVDSAKSFKPLELSFLSEKQLPQKPQRKSWKNALTAVSGLLRKSWSQLPLQHTKRISFSKSVQDNLTFESLDKAEAGIVDTIDSKTQCCSDVVIQSSINENINIKAIYQASYKKIQEKKPLLEQILISNFIISIVDTNKDVTLSRPKTIRKKLSRTVFKRKGDTKKAREFLMKKGVTIVDYRNIGENTEKTKRVPGKAKKQIVLEEDVPLALLKQSQ